MLDTTIGDSWLSLPNGFLYCSLDCNKDQLCENVCTLIFKLLTLGVFHKTEKKSHVFFYSTN